VSFELFGDIASDQSFAHLLTEATITSCTDGFKATLRFDDEVNDTDSVVREFILPASTPMLEKCLKLLLERAHPGFCRVDAACFERFSLVRMQKDTSITDDDIPF
jgi:hypothetical protein